MLTRWGGVIVAWRRWIAVAALLLAVVGVAWGSGVFDRLVTGGFEDPGSESARANARLAQTVGGQNPDVLALYSSPRLTVDAPSFREPVMAVVQRVRTARARLRRPRLIPTPEPAALTGRPRPASPGSGAPTDPATRWRTP